MVVSLRKVVLRSAKYFVYVTKKLLFLVRQFQSVHTIAEDIVAETINSVGRKLISLGNGKLCSAPTGNFYSVLVLGKFDSTPHRFDPVLQIWICRIHRDSQVTKSFLIRCL